MGDGDIGAAACAFNYARAVLEERDAWIGIARAWRLLAKDRMREDEYEMWKAKILGSGVTRSEKVDACPCCGRRIDEEDTNAIQA